MTILGFVFLAGYSLKGLYLAYAEATGAYHRLDYASHDIVHLGGFSTLLGTIFFIFGYLFFSKNFFFPKDFDHSNSRHEFWNLAYYFLFIVSVTLMVIYFFQMGFFNQLINLRFTAQKYFYLEGGEQTSLAYLTIGGEFLMIFFIYYCLFEKKFTILHPIILSIIFCCICYFLASRRNGIMIIVGLYLIASYSQKSLADMRSVVSKYGVIITIFLLLSFAAVIRSGGGEKEISQLQLTDAVSESLEQTFSGSYFMDPAKTAIIIETVERKDLFLGGVTYLEFVIAPIPRVIWPQKPDVRNSYFVADEILDLRTNSGVPPSGMAELYMNFGWAGIILGMFLVGALVRIVYNRCSVHLDDNFSRAQYAIWMLCISLFFLVDWTMAILFFIRFQMAAFIVSRYWAARTAKDLGQSRPAGAMTARAISWAR